MPDLSSLLPLLSGNPTLLALGAAAVLLWQRFRPAPAPTPGPNPPAPAPTPSPAPIPTPGPTGRPLLDLLLSLLRSRGPAAVAEAVAAANPAELVAVRRQIDGTLAEFRAALAPEPARPVS